MRKLLTALLLMLSTAGWGQTYYPLPDSNAVWSVLTVEVSMDPLGNGDFFETHNYSINGDTTINAKQYNRIFTTSDSILNYDASDYVCAVREDTLKRVYYIKENDTIEKLLYDFSLEVGDTAWVFPINGGSFCSWEDGCELVVESVDSILIDNNYRRQLHLNTIDGEVWIEGIGSSLGLLNPGSLIADMGYELLCFTENDTTKYTSPNYGNCYINTVSIDEKVNRYKMNIYPNPVSGMLHIETTEKIAVEIYNVYGELVQVATGKEIDFAPYNKGVYFVVIKTATTTFYKRVVKI